MCISYIICSSLMLSASNQVYQSLANLIRWSDNILLYGEKAAEKENVVEIVQAVRDAVKVTFPALNNHSN